MGNLFDGPVAAIVEAIRRMADLPLEDRVKAVNEIRVALHGISPFREEPVDCVLWVKSDSVKANDYNPNKVASPEMKLLRHSIRHDGYTQPIVTFAEDDQTEVVDGFHRHIVGKSEKDIAKRLHGYLPIVRINSDRGSREDRVAATVRHNRARGKHGVEAMSELVADLSKRGWDDAKIASELGMDSDEVLRLKQITGLAELFADREFSEAWDTTP